MTALQKLAIDTRRYLKLLNENGSCTRLELVFVVDYWAVVFHRLQEMLVEMPGGIRQVLKMVIWCLKPIIEGLTGSRIKAGASIGPGFVVFNSFGIAISASSVIGENCTIYSGVFIAHKANDKNSGVPVIGNGVVLMSGCKVLGDITIGDDSIIGANSVVLADVAAATIATGVPANIFRKLNRSSESYYVHD
jgi:serine O-acetyltransferase